MTRLIFGLICVLALGVTGCGETTGDPGGSGDDGGMGGDGGAAGVGGGGAGGWPSDRCVPLEDRCESVEVEPHEACCDLEVPEQANACGGTESLLNPTTCTPTGDRVFYKLTAMEVEPDCSVGYDLDRCDGESCARGGLAPGDGIDGVDNAVAGLGPLLAGFERNLGGYNKALSDSLCGLRDDVENGDCLRETAVYELRFVVDANPAEHCAHVTVLAAGEAADHVLNLSDDGCLSGALGTIPLWVTRPYGSLQNVVARMTVSPVGFSHGLIGGSMDPEATGVLWETVITGAVDIVLNPFDMAVSTSVGGDGLAKCDGLSATFRIGGVVEDPRITSSEQGRDRDAGPRPD